MAEYSNAWLEEAMARPANTLNIRMRETWKIFWSELEFQTDCSYKLSQPFLIDQILRAMGFINRTKVKAIPGLKARFCTWTKTGLPIRCHGGIGKCLASSTSWRN